MKQLTNVCLVISVLVLSALSQAADGVVLSTAEDGSTIARNSAGEVMWQRYNTAFTTTSAAASSPHIFPPSATTPMWDPLTIFPTTPPGSYMKGPTFDSLGNAWFVISDSVNLMAIQSNGTSGTWHSPQIIGPGGQGVGTVGMTADQAGGFYVTYGTSLNSDNTHPLLLTKYTPASGWKAPATIYNGSFQFTETFPMIDSTGRLVVVFNANGVSSIASNPAQSSWGTVQVIASASASPVLPTAAGNKSGTRLALVYLSFQRGLRYCFFNSSSALWDPVIQIPNSQKATFSSYSGGSAFPMAVDETGNVTVISALTVPPGRYTVGGFRYEGGQWTEQNVLPVSRSLPDTDNFGSIALNANGTVLAAVPTSDGGSGTNISVFRYTPGAGWDTEIAAFFNAPGASHCRVAWFESTEAVVTYLDFSTTQVALRAALFSNGVWGSGPAIPGNLADPFPYLGTAPTGEVLLGMTTDQIYVTWLRP